MQSYSSWSRTQFWRAPNQWPMCSRPVGRMPEKTRSRVRVGALAVAAGTTKDNFGLRHAVDGSITNLAGMDAEEAIRSRRTVKAFDRRAVERETLEELLELARWAPNHNLTNPWRFRVVGPQALERLKQAAGELGANTAPAGADKAECARVAAAKLDRAPTLVVCSAQQTGDDHPGRGGHARSRRGRLHRPARRARARARGLLAHPGRAAHRRRPVRRRLSTPTSASSACSIWATRSRPRSPPGREPVERYAQFLD